MQSVLTYDIIIPKNEEGRKTKAFSERDICGAELITLHPDSSWDVQQIPLTSIS